MPKRDLTRPGLTKDGALVSDLLKLLLKIRSKDAGVAAKLIARSTSSRHSPPVCTRVQHFEGLAVLTNSEAMRSTWSKGGWRCTERHQVAGNSAVIDQDRQGPGRQTARGKRVIDRNLSLLLLTSARPPPAPCNGPASGPASGNCRPTRWSQLHRLALPDLRPPTA